MFHTKREWFQESIQTNWFLESLSFWGEHFSKIPATSIPGVDISHSATYLFGHIIWFRIWNQSCNLLYVLFLWALGEGGSSIPCGRRMRMVRAPQFRFARASRRVQSVAFPAHPPLQWSQYRRISPVRRCTSCRWLWSDDWDCANVVKCPLNVLCSRWNIISFELQSPSGCCTKRPWVSNLNFAQPESWLLTKTSSQRPCWP